MQKKIDFLKVSHWYSPLNNQKSFIIAMCLKLRKID